MTDPAVLWWDLEGGQAYRATALVAASTAERAIALVVEYLTDPLDLDDSLTRGWHVAADELEPGVPQDSNLPAPPGAEGVYHVYFTTPDDDQS